MSYSVNFYRFAKKANSTKQPTSDPDVTYQCEIMPGTSILAPTLKLNTNFLDPSNLTYAFIPTLTRFYFVSNWYYDRGLWQCDLQTDVLASYKTQIGNFSLYVLRSSYEMDGRIVDTSYPVKSAKNFARSIINPNPFDSAFTNGYFIVGIINGDAAAIGVTSYYIFSNSEFRAFVSFLLGSTAYLNSPAEISDELLKCLVNPTQYITSCIWTPFYPTMGPLINTINVGWWSLTATCHRLVDGGLKQYGVLTVPVPKHPEALTRGYYLLDKPYTTYYLSIPPFGAISIDPSDLIDSDNIILEWSCDLITGRAKLDIYNQPPVGTPAVLLSVLEGQLGVPVALAQNAPQISVPQQISPTNNNVNPYEWAHISKSAGHTAFGKWVNEKIDTVNAKIDEFMSTNSAQISNIANAVVSSQLPVQVLGGNGGFTGASRPIVFNASFAVLTEDNTAEWGRPLCRTKTLNTIPGFIQCAESDFEINCTAEERNAIGRYLTGGFFYE